MRRRVSTSRRWHGVHPPPSRLLRPPDRARSLLPGGPIHAGVSELIPPPQLVMLAQSGELSIAFVISPCASVSSIVVIVDDSAVLILSIDAVAAVTAVATSARLETSPTAVSMESTSVWTVVESPSTDALMSSPDSVSVCRDRRGRP